ncbi:hypothetical protein [[Clostridium] fimetarium]|uniref:Lipoprotein n=1 Tax=[Clostridium] fimetarium TaxID=99656 RepID=A0A1I0LZJ3_9FIRM|nr:hypothetical protein [[Clostridium] fimetarium]SEV81483.1 hypothetical protein SAMN05421659_10119 [[Clostridium] fimetarium]
MKTARLVIGIVSIVLFVLVALQSCAAGLGNALQENGEVSGSAGLMLAFFLLIAGIIGIAARKTKGGTITAGCFYAVGGLIGISNVGSYGDLAIWSVLSFIFAVVFIVGAIVQKKPALIS